MSRASCPFVDGRVFFSLKKNKNLMINSSLLLCYFVILIRDECQVHWMGLKVEFLIDNKIDQK